MIETWAENCREGDGKENSRKSHENIDQTHEQLIRPSAEISRQ
jgi:hypothetical protein